MLTIEKIHQIINKLAPEKYNSIIIDEAEAPKRHDYCYIHASVQKVEFRTDSTTIAIDKQLGQALTDNLQLDTSQTNKEAEQPYIAIDPHLAEQIDKSPKAQSSNSFLSNAKKRMSEFINGGRDVDHRMVTLLMEDNKIASKQPRFAVRKECSISLCPECHGNTIINNIDKQGNETTIRCTKCDGLGHIASLTWFTPVVNDKETTMTTSLDEIENLKTSIVETHKGNQETMTRMVQHYNGTDLENYADELIPYLDRMHDKTGEQNTLEDIYFKIIPCYTFTYRNVLTNQLQTGIVIEPGDNAQLIIDASDNNIFGGIKDRIKKINNFFGNIGKTESFKDKDDLRRTLRLLIAIAVADGNVSDNEKQSLTLSIRNIDMLTNSDRNQLLQLLNMNDSSFLTDDDFKFHNRETAETTLKRMQEIASSDGNVDETERDIIERLRFKY